MFCSSLCKERSRVVPVAAVGKERDDDFAGVLGFLRLFDSGGEGGTGGDADRDALGLREQFGGGEGLFAGGAVHFVVDGRVECLGDEPGADALDLMGARAALGQDRGVVRLDGDDLDGSLLLLQVFAGARDGAAGADAGNEDVDRAGRGSPG